MVYNNLDKGSIDQNGDLEILLKWASAQGIL